MSKYNKTIGLLAHNNQLKTIQKLNMNLKEFEVLRSPQTANFNDNKALIIIN